MTDSQRTAPLNQAASGATGRRRPSQIAGLDGCRALAAIGVLTFHVWAITGVSNFPFSTPMSNLRSSVSLFFGLSALLLYRPFAAAAIRGTSKPRVGTYLRNRFLRIAPAYWLVLLVAALLGVAELRAHGAPYFGHITNPSYLLQDMLLVQNYNPGQVQTGIITAWSLTVEVAFYLLLPVLGATALWLARGRSSRTSRRNAALVPALAMWCIGMTVRLVAIFSLHAPLGSGSADWNTVIVSSIFAKADLFAYGMAVAVLRVEWEDGRVRLSGWRRWGVWALLIVLAGWAAGTNTNAAFVNTTAWVQDVDFGLVSGLLLLLVISSEPVGGTRFRLVRLLESRPLVWGGLISYGVFLWHFPVLIWLARHGVLHAGRRLDLPVDLVFVLLPSIALATLTYWLVERPILARRRRYAQPAETPTSAAEPAGVVVIEPSVARSSS